MKFSKYGIVAISSITLTVLTACGGAGSAGPTAPAVANYGEMVSESQQSLGMYSNMAVLYPVMLQAGKYGTINGASISPVEPYQKANTKNTNTVYKFDPYGALTASGYFKASSVKAYAVQYKTQGQNGDTIPSQVVRTASGLIILPNISNIRGVVVYFHPTSFGKNQVPSCIGPIQENTANWSSNLPSYCNLTSLDETGAGIFDMLSALYAARGFAVVAPDYVGQGADWDNVHPYVAFPENNVLSAFNMFPSLRKILNDNGVATTQKLPLFITGYSEGGGYALKASQMAQGSSASILANNNLELKITSPQEGAYSLTDQMNFAFNDNNDGMFNCSSNPSYNCGSVDIMKTSMSKEVTPEVSAMNSWNIVSSPAAATYKPILTSYVLTAAMFYDFNNLGNAYNFAMETQFWSNISMPDGALANFYQLYSGIDGSKYTGDQISASIVKNSYLVNNYDKPTTPSITLFTPTGSSPFSISAGRYGANSPATLFINSGITGNPVFQNILTSGSTYNWQSNSPINFIHMVYDSAVTVLNSHEAYSCMKNGTNFVGSNGMVSSGGVCSTATSGNMIESTIIPNFQVTNNGVQLSPMNSLDPTNVNPLANAKFWSLNKNLNMVIPFDHGDMFVLGSIIALCTFENQIKDGTNSGICPTLQ